MCLRSRMALSGFLTVDHSLCWTRKSSRKISCRSISAIFDCSNLSCAKWYVPILSVYISSVYYVAWMTDICVNFWKNQYAYRRTFHLFMQNRICGVLRGSLTVLIAEHTIISSFYERNLASLAWWNWWRPRNEADWRESSLYLILKLSLIFMIWLRNALFHLS